MLQCLVISCLHGTKLASDRQTLPVVVAETALRARLPAAYGRRPQSAGKLDCSGFRPQLSLSEPSTSVLPPTSSMTHLTQSIFFAELMLISHSYLSAVRSSVDKGHSRPAQWSLSDFSRSCRSSSSRWAPSPLPIIFNNFHSKKSFWRPNSANFDIV